MSVKIRLARGGAKKKPFYRVVIADARAPRDGKFIEKVGTYNPMLGREDQNRISLNSERISYWLDSGAKPTETVVKFIKQAGITLPKAIEDKIQIRAKGFKNNPSKKELKEQAAK